MILVPVDQARNIRSATARERQRRRAQLGIMSSPESEMLDQLLSGDMPLAIIRTVYADDAAFLKGIHGLLTCGNVRLLAVGQIEVPHWRWHSLFVDGAVLNELDKLS